MSLKVTWRSFFFILYRLVHWQFLRLRSKATSPPPPFRKHQKRGEMTGDEIVQEIKPEQASRCDLYGVIIQDAYIDMNWVENLNHKVVGARDYSLKEMANVPSLQGRHVSGSGTEDSSEGGPENGFEDGPEDCLGDELVDDLEVGPDDNMEDRLSNYLGSGSKET